MNPINPSQETKKITTFLKNVFEENKIENVVIGLSGGIDSATSFALLTHVLPPQHIFPTHLSYFKKSSNTITQMVKDAGIPKKNFYNLSIKTPVDVVKEKLEIDNRHSGPAQRGSRIDSGVAPFRGSSTSLPRMTTLNQMRLGNTMARIRMIYLYDLAKKHNALVCGTENKSEHYLGYFTRFGDEASDIEPIRHLYKTQIYQLATYLKVPQAIINAKPTAGLWAGQTDEKEFGFTYQEADEVLYYFLEEKLTIDAILKKGYVNAKQIIKRVLENEYKQQTPYSLT